MSIRESTPVRIINGEYQGKTGKVVSVYDILGVAIVALEDGNFAKVSKSELVEIQPQESQEVNSEIPEGAKRLTREIVKNAIVEVLSPDKIFSGEGEPASKFTSAIATMIVSEYFVKGLFSDEDVRVMTEDQFIVELWDRCSPEAVAETIDNKMSVRSCITIALAACTYLQDTVSIIFDESDND